MKPLTTINTVVESGFADSVHKAIKNNVVFFKSLIGLSMRPFPPQSERRSATIAAFRGSSAVAIDSRSDSVTHGFVSLTEMLSHASTSARPRLLRIPLMGPPGNSVTHSGPWRERGRGREGRGMKRGGVERGIEF